MAHYAFLEAKILRMEPTDSFQMCNMRFAFSVVTLHAMTRAYRPFPRLTQLSMEINMSIAVKLSTLVKKHHSNALVNATRLLIG